MKRDEWLAEEFEANRSRLSAVAYRMLGSHAEADDAVQEAWVRLAGADADAIDNLAGWLTTVVARVCLDRLRARRSRPEEPAGTELPRADPAADEDPADHAVMYESIGAALLVVLDALAPAERVAFVLHDVFAVPFADIGEVLDRTPESARQLASRARKRVQGTAPTGEVDLVRHRAVVEEFLRAARGEGLDTLMRLLDPDVVLRPDAAAVGLGTLREARGASTIAGMLTGGARFARLAVVDGVTGLVWAPGGRIRGFAEFTVRDGRIVAIDVTGDPDRLARVEIVPLNS
jgi:RNA polymerase sigma-70 factor (ECF subfamily)